MGIWGGGVTTWSRRTKCASRIAVVYLGDFTKIRKKTGVFPKLTKTKISGGKKGDPRGALGTSNVKKNGDSRGELGTS